MASEDERVKVAVVGLGLMGGTFAGHLLDAGRRVVGYDPDPDRRTEHVERGGDVAASVADAAAEADAVLLSLPNSDVALDVCAEIGSDGAALVIDATTGRPEDSIRAAADLADRGVAYVDATVSGNATMAAAKDTIFMVGGAHDDVARATDVLGLVGRAVHHVGPVGAGSTAKLIVNHVLSINRAAVAEGLVVAEKASIDLTSILAVLRDSAAHSKAMDIWGERMVAGDHHPPNARITQSLKDSHLINEHAEAVGASHELVEVVCRIFTEARDGGLADADNSSVMEVMRRRAGIPRN